MDFNKLKEKAFAKGITQIEIYSSVANSVDFTITDEEMEQRNVSDSNVAFIRGVYNNQLVGYYTENLEDGEIDKIIDYLTTASEYITDDTPFFIYEGDKEYKEVVNPEFKLKDVSLQDKIEFALNINRKIKASTKYYFHTSVAYYEGTSSSAIKNTKGLDLEHHGSSAIIYVMCDFKKGDEIKNFYKAKRLLSFDDINVDELVDEVVRETECQFDAKSVKSGTYKAIIHRDALKSLLGAYSGAFFSTVLKRKLSFLEGKEGTKVFGDNISIVDDPFYFEDTNKQAFDDEGVSTKQNDLVTNGVFNTFLYNLSTAAYFNKKSTGSGFKPAVNANVSVDFTTLRLLPGEKSYDNLVKDLGNGIIITSLSGLHAGVNALTGDFNLQSSGFMVEDGKITRYVTLFVTSGNFIDILNNTLEVGNDTEYYGGIATPSILVKSLNISGE